MLAITAAATFAFLLAPSVNVLRTQPLVRMCDADELPDKFDFDAGLLKCAPHRAGKKMNVD